MFTLKELRGMVDDVLGEGMPLMQPPTGFEMSAGNESDTGGSGDEHEINWGDVVDVIKEQLDVGTMVHECIARLRMQQVDEANRPLEELPEFVQLQEVADDFAEAFAGLLKQAHKEGMLSNAEFNR